VQAQTKEYWRELCEMAVNEQDPVTFLTIVREINTLLELKRGRFEQTGPQLVTDEPALARCSLPEFLWAEWKSGTSCHPILC